ncbi:MAG TPA: filamentous hemagglutinin family protein, partial [Rhizomicrobium sp.]|nr:filamentous hemagglutinin family protein [Rhizomicrobium sp.]
PWLPNTGASLYVEFGVGKGADYDAFRNYYLDPANLANLDGSLFVQVKDAAGDLVPDRSQPIYGPVLINWMQQNAAAQLVAAYGTTSVTYAQAYTAFAALPELQQRIFILDNVYFNELEQTSIPTSPSYKQYSRGYRAVNTLFPASLGYTQNDLSGGGNGANQLVQTGDLDLRLAAIETTRGGNIYILGPGGRVLAGSTVATASQAARRAYIGGSLFSGNVNNEPLPSAITDIPAGFEGILTLRGGSIDTFTDDDFLLNQSRLFTEDGGDIEMWSSNGSLNAGQGPKTSANFPPIVVQVDEDLFSQVDSVGGVTGAGIAAFESDPSVTPPDVFLIAPRGTVDAGAAGVRVAGNLFIAALTVANASNFSVGGTSFGIPAAASVAIGTQTSASSASAAAAQAAQSVASAARSTLNDMSVITVDVMGYVGDDNSEDEKRRKKKK